MRFERDDAKIGLLVIAAVAVFIALVFHRSLTAVVEKETILQVRLENVSGLEVGTEVQLQGFRVGQVNQVELKREGAEYYYLATLGIQPEIVLWKGTIAVVGSKGIGSAILDLDLPPLENRRTPLEPGEVLFGETGASMGTLITQVQTFVKNLDESVAELRGHLQEKGLGAVLDHPNVRNVLVDLDRTLIEFRKVATQGQGTVEILDRGLTSLEKSAVMVETLMNKRSGDIDASIKDLASLLKELQALSVDANRLLKSSGPEMEASLKSLHRNLKATEELLEILKNKPSRVLWGTPSEAEKEAARKRAEEGQTQGGTPIPPPAP